MTYKLEATEQAMLTGLCKAIVATFHPRLAALEQRIAELEGGQAKSLADCFRGPWLPETTYRRGELVQHRGSVWIALAADVAGKPGETDGWRLLVRAGRDGVGQR